jgi:4a-hydroxytetrahydrobiopterin dehydratase
MIKKLTSIDIDKFLAVHTSWTINSKGRLYRDIKSKHYTKLVDQLLLITKLSDQLNHHPDISLVWGSLKLTLYTHEVNAVTTRDIALIEVIDLSLS